MALFKGESFKNKIMRLVNFGQIFFFSGFIVTIFFNYGYPIIDTYKELLGENKIYTQTLIYLSDIFLLGFSLLSLIYSKYTLERVNQSSKRLTYLYYTPAILLALQTLSILNNSGFLPIEIPLSWYILSLKGVLVFYIVSKQSKNLLKVLLLSVVASGVLQSIIAILQFAKQSSLGLVYLGEPILLQNTWGISTFFTENGIVLRSYGTLPHPNILGMLLGISIISTLFLAINSSIKNANSYVLYYLLIFLQVFALITTFSRTSAFAIIITIGLYIGLEIRKIISDKSKIAFFVCIILSSAFLIFAFSPEINSRPITTTSTSFKERAGFIEKGFEMISDNPVLGLGPGGNLFHMEQYYNFWIYPWENQPIHNIFLVFTVDHGVIAGSLFLLFVLLTYLRLFKGSIQNGKTNPEIPYILSIFTLIIILALNDHYFYSIQPGVLIFWLFCALAYSNPAKNELLMVRSLVNNR